MKPSKNREDALQLLRDLADLITRTVQDATGLDQDTALYVGQEAANQFAADFGKQLVYIPSGIALQVSSRNQDIYAEFTGANQAELARKYNLSLQWVYSVIKRMRKADLASRQGDMFSDTKSDWICAVTGEQRVTPRPAAHKHPPEMHLEGESK